MSSQSSQHNVNIKYRADIDGLRALSIVAVVAFHAYPEWITGGFVGVDVFFVISGFLISSIIFAGLDNGDFSFADFYARRAKRIFPALILVLLASLVAGWLFLLPEEYKQLGKHVVASVVFAQNIALWKETGYFDSGIESKPIMHLWSLGIEEQFYLIFPFLVWGLWRFQFKPLILVVLLLVVSFGGNLQMLEADPAGAFFLPHTRFWELMAGSLLAYWRFKPVSNEIRENRLAGFLKYIRSNSAQKTPSHWIDDSLAWMGLFLIVGAFLNINGDMKFPGWRGLLPVFGAMLIIQAGPTAWVNRILLANRLMVGVGVISYPLYLWHWPLFAYARLAASEPPSDGLLFVLIVLSLALAILTYRLIERPIRFGTPFPATTIVLCLFMVGLGVGGFYASKTGFKNRFPKVVRELENYQPDFAKLYRQDTCLIGAKQADKGFDETCYATRRRHENATAKAALLWGDSYAAHLYPGMKPVFAKDLMIDQLTTIACPPLVDLDLPKKPYCKSLNTAVADKILSKKYDVVILAANWEGYVKKGYDIGKEIRKTLQKLKVGGVGKFIIVGPPPNWPKGLPRTLFEIFRSNGLHQIPYRTTIGLSQKTAVLDDSIQQIAAAEQIEYLSPWRLLCDKAGCLTRTGDTAAHLMAFDGGHLTANGSETLFRLYLESGQRRGW